MKPVYSTSATVTGGRDGRVLSEDGNLELKLVAPKELGGAGGEGTNPEQLFAAGYAACFESALRLAARKAKKPLNDARIKATVGLGPREAGGFGLSAALHVVTDGITQQEAEELVEKVHNEICPYSNAIRGNVDVAVTVEANG